MTDKKRNKCLECGNNFKNPGYNINMDLDLCPKCNNLKMESEEEKKIFGNYVKI